ncbi:MAG: 30S ribosomal protein S7 [Patescibacteria group bacterium]|jgi:small subunit ribosomal protein S7
MHGKQAKKRIIKPDTKYKSVAIAKFINYVMERGKKSVAQKIVYSALDLVAEKTGKKPLDAFELAIRNVSPVVEVKSRRVGGANYQVPIEVRGERKMALAYRWLLEAARNKKGKPMHEKLATEIIGSINNEGDAIKKKQDVHRMAEANRAFAHFA